MSDLSVAGGYYLHPFCRRIRLKRVIETRETKEGENYDYYSVEMVVSPHHS
jgi:hypothetical protein